MLKNNLTIAVITYNRPQKLTQCLNSILKQNSTPPQIIIIDNDNNKSSFSTFNKFKKTLNLHYFVQPKKSRSHARNLALSKCRTDYLAFIDDDCLLNKNWYRQAIKNISKNPDTTFFLGKSILKNRCSFLALIQHKNYQHWFLNQKNLNFCLDTKNLIINLKSLKNLHFDIKFPIFEDIDFGLQINKANLSGKYIPNLIIYHPEETNIFKIFKKNYHRGQIKYQLKKKWGNFDNFSPKLSIKSFNLINYFFNLGYLKEQKKDHQKSLIIILNTSDKSANQERSQIFLKYLKDNNYNAIFADSSQIFKQTVHNLSSLFIYHYYYLTYILSSFLKFHLNFKSDTFYLWSMLKLRGLVISRYLKKNNPMLVISQYPEDFFFTLNPHNYKIILDNPTIYSEELRLKQTDPSKIIKKIKEKEKQIYLKSDYLSFHWYSFFELAQKLKIKINQPLTLNWGCESKHKFSQYQKDPKIIYLGKLNSQWVNPKLLENLHKRFSPSLEIFSYENPDKQLYSSLKTKGYLKNLNNISNYQFGLLTFTNDQLRNNGFSAKHLTYISFGLPVFCPEWRKDPFLEPATIYYNETNFKSQFKKYSQKKFWLQKHQAALKLAKKLNWETTLKPILPVIYKIQNEQT